MTPAAAELYQRWHKLVFKPYRSEPTEKIAHKIWLEAIREGILEAKRDRGYEILSGHGVPQDVADTLAALRQLERDLDPLKRYVVDL